MEQVSVREMMRLQGILKHMVDERQPWEAVWRDLSKNYLPRTYVFLASEKEQRTPQKGRNTHLLTSVSTNALNVLANGLMDGITSPSRVWFRLLPRQEMREHLLPYEWSVWLEDAREIIMGIFASSNFYPALRKLYREFACFGTASLSVADDPDTLLYFRNHAIGEFYLQCDDKGTVIRHGRKFIMTTEDLEREFGLENLPTTIRAQANGIGTLRFTKHTVCCLVEPNTEGELQKRKSAKYREIYWIGNGGKDEVLGIYMHDFKPNLTPRWETYARDPYGTSPCWDALPDVISQQHMVRRRGQGLDRAMLPPLLVNKSLADNPQALVAGGISYVRSNDLKSGAAPAFMIDPRFQEVSAMLNEGRGSIQETLYNDLFQAIARLQTVRSATEIEALKAERVVLLAPMLEQFERETLRPAIQLAYEKGRASGMIAPPPSSEFTEEDVVINFVGVLAEAQRAVGVASIERYMQIIGNLAPVFPEDVLDVPDIEQMLRSYSRGIGLKPSLNRSPNDTAERRKAREEQRAQQEAAIQGQELIGGAQQLSQTELGGGQTALNALLG